MVEESRRTGQILKAFNATFLMSIPKEHGADMLGKFRLISLCNVILKIITKVMANRLKPLMSGLISLEKMGFIEGRKILDGIILTHEMIHSLKQAKAPRMLIKVDLTKAYDKVSWRFMKDVLKAFGFQHDWVRWIGNLLSSSFFSILLNGVSSTTFQASRGLRQGDPLSPFLFNLMAEGLDRDLKVRQVAGDIKGVGPHKGMVPQTHQ